ncbi:hypothetical protein F1713_12540, partial [Streptococcus pneumoniae]
ELIILIPISFVLTITSAVTFVDIWHFFSLVTRYENEDKYDYLTGLGINYTYTYFIRTNDYFCCYLC